MQVRPGTGLRVLAIDLEAHVFNHFWLFAMWLFVVVNEIAALDNPDAYSRRPSLHHHGKNFLKSGAGAAAIIPLGGVLSHREDRK